MSISALATRSGERGSEEREEVATRLFPLVGFAHLLEGQQQDEQATPLAFSCLFDQLICSCSQLLAVR